MIEEAHEIALPVPRAKLISRNAFKYHFKQNVDQLELIRKAVGTTNFQKDYRVVQALLDRVFVAPQVAMK